jgi:pseudouridine kinase
MRIVCVGGANIDRKYVLPGNAIPQTSNPAGANASFGGVARNIAENLARLGADVALLAVVGDDVDGAALRKHAAEAGIDVAWLKAKPGRRTTEYAAIIDGAGELVIGVNDMALLNDCLAGEIALHREELLRAEWVFLDCNLPQATIAEWIGFARERPMRLAIDAVSEPKIERLPSNLTGVDVLFLNDGEARAYLGSATDDGLDARARAIQRRGAAAVVLTLGDQGLIVADATGTSRIPAVNVSAVDVTGAGDALVGATLWRLSLGDDIVSATRVGTHAAALTVESKSSVRADLAEQLLSVGKKK